MSDIKIFENLELGFSVRTLEENGKVLFCAKDVALSLGYSDWNDAVDRHCEGGGVKRPTTTSSGIRDMTYLIEPDMYRLVFGSKLESAKKFKDWVFEDVLPSIRKTGGYVLPSKLDDFIQNTLKPRNAVLDSFNSSEAYKIKELVELTVDFRSKTGIDVVPVSLPKVSTPNNTLLPTQGTHTAIVEVGNNIITLMELAKTYCVDSLVMNDWLISNGYQTKHLVHGSKKNYYFATKKGILFADIRVLNSGLMKGTSIVVGWMLKDKLKEELDLHFLKPTIVGSKVKK